MIATRFPPIVAVLLAQLLFTTGDTLARINLRGGGFGWPILTAPWFWGYWAIRIAATMLQLYALSNLELGRNAALFGATSIILSNTIGFFLIGDVLPVKAYYGVALAIAAFAVLGFIK